MNLCLHGLEPDMVMRDVYFREDYAALHCQDASTEGLISDKFRHISAVRRIPGTSFQDMETPWGYGGPVGSDARQLANGISEWKAHQKRKGRIAEFIRLHPFLNPLALDEHADFLSFNRTTVLVDLKKKAGERLKEMDRPTRRRLRVAETALNVRLMEDGEWPVFRDCYEAGLKGNNADSRYFFSDSFYRQLLAAPYTTTWAADLADRTICVGTFLHAGNLAHTHLSGGLPEAREHHAAYLIHARAIEHFSQAGYRWLHMGGGKSPGEHDSLLNFKKKFSPLRTAFFTAGFVFDRDRYEKLGGARHGIFQGYRTSHGARPLNDGLTLREATLSDFATYFKVLSDPENMRSAGLRLPPCWSERKCWFSTQIEARERTFFIAETTNSAVGFAWAREDDDLAEISFYTTSPDREDVAKRILAQLLKRLFPAKFSRVECQVTPEDTVAVMTLEAAGFVMKSPPTVVDDTADGPRVRWCLETHT